MTATSIPCSKKLAGTTSKNKQTKTNTHTHTCAIHSQLGFFALLHPGLLRLPGTLFCDWVSVAVNDAAALPGLFLQAFLL